MVELEEAGSAPGSFYACRTHEGPRLQTTGVFFKVRDRVINHNIRRKLCGERPVRVDAVLFP